MRVTAQTTEVGDSEAVFICNVPAAGVLVKNVSSDARVFLGGAGVTADGEQAGYPLDPGESQVFRSADAHESPAVPAPADDMAPAGLHGRSAGGTVQVAWIAAG